ncbi:hypothetical protein CR513_22263, partial [Mucuna pruriens]
MKNKRKQIHAMDSSHSDSPNNQSTLFQCLDMHPLLNLNLTEMVMRLILLDNAQQWTLESYQEKPEFVPILRKILTKHRDVFKNCTASTNDIPFNMICDIILDLQDNNLDKIIKDELHNMIALASEIKNNKVNIEWLHLRLEEICEARKILKQNVKRELEECEAEKKAVEAKMQLICDKECLQGDTEITETITHAKSKARRFFNFSLVD